MTKIRDDKTRIKSLKDQVLKLKQEIMFQVFINIREKPTQPNLDLLKRCGIDLEEAQKFVDENWSRRGK